VLRQVSALATQRLIHAGVMRHAKTTSMKGLLTITLTIFTFLSCFSQDWEKRFRQELFESLVNPTDSIYVMDRKQLERIAGMTCNDKVVMIKSTTQNGDKIEIKIEKGDFEPTKHQIYLNDTIPEIVNGRKLNNVLEVKNLIDNRYSFGIDGTMPRTEIKSISIKWKDINLLIPDSAFSNLYEPHLCSDYLSVEAYIFKNKNLFVYVNASDGAGGYSVKFVFDKEKYLTRIVATNEMTNGYDFLDGTTKYED
jgi:hypothetical protein